MLEFHFYYKIILNIYFVSFLLGLSIYINNFQILDTHFDILLNKCWRQ